MKAIVKATALFWVLIYSVLFRSVQSLPTPLDLDAEEPYEKRCCGDGDSSSGGDNGSAGPDPKLWVYLDQHTPTLATTHVLEAPKIMKMEMHHGPTPAKALPAPLMSKKAGASYKQPTSGAFKLPAIRR